MRRNAEVFLCTVTCALTLIMLTTNSQAQLNSNPKVVSYSVKTPESVSNGEAFGVDVQFRTQPGWYIYAPTGANSVQGMIETKVLFVLPNGLSRVGKLKLPEPEIKNGYEIYEGDSIAFRQPLKFSPTLTEGSYPIKTKIIWQACSSESCLPPVTDEIVTVIYYKPK